MRPTRTLLGALCLAGLVGCADDQAAAPPQTAAPAPTAVVATSAERTAIVESVNAAERSVLLRGDSGAQGGTLATIRVGPQVRNFAQIKSGDRVVYTVTSAIAASIARPDGAAPAAAAAIASRAPAGDRPAATVTDAARVRLRVVSVDTRANTVTVVGPEGAQRVLAVQSAEGRRFIRTLRPGNDVDVVVVEQADLRVLPPA